MAANSNVNPHVVIFFGIILQDAQGEAVMAPWLKAGFKCEVEWWARLTGWEPTVEIYEEWGKFIGGKHPGREVFDRYFEHRREWGRLHPANFSSIALGGHKQGFTAICANFTCHGFGDTKPETAFKPSDLKISAEDVEAFKQNCIKMGFEIEPSWHCAVIE